MKVSVITICLNSENTILDNLKSVKGQSFKNIEHIIIDGGSTDKTLEIIKGFQNPNLKLFSEKDEGIYDAMNKGIEKSSGDLIGFLNSDDLFYNEKSMNEMVHQVKINSSEAVYSDLVYISQDKRKILRYWKSNRFKRGSFSRGWAPPHPTFYFKKEYKNIKFDLRYKISSDVDLMMRLLEIKSISVTYLPKITVKMRIGGVSNSSFKNIFNQNKEVFESLKVNNQNFHYSFFIFFKLFNRINQKIKSYFIQIENN